MTTAVDYMTARSASILDRADAKFTKLAKATGQPVEESKIHAVVDFVGRLGALSCLSRDILMRLVSNPELAEAPAPALAARSVALAECLLAELGQVEKGDQITEEENMMQGSLFGLFRQWHYEKMERK